MENIFAIPPTGFGKSLIFHVFPLAKYPMNGKPGAVCIIVVVRLAPSRGQNQRPS